MMGFKGVLCSAAASFVAIGFVACSAPPTSEEEVSARALERIDALIAQDYERAFEYASPAYRQSLGLTDYRRRYAGAGAWRGAEVRRVECEEDACDVTLALRYLLRAPGPAGGEEFVNERGLDERWIRVQGEWYLYIK